MNRELLERTIANLEAKELIDGEVMEAANLEQLRNDIASLKRLLPTEKSELRGCYSPSNDMTFVIKATYVGKELHTEECVGWYHGEPSDECNESFSHGELMAVYDWND